MLPEPWERQLPISLTPAPGESLAGYLLCLAERTLSSPNDIALRTGLIDHRRHVPLAHASALPENVAERFAAATGNTARQAQAMTLASYDGKLFTHVDGASSTAGHAWRSVAGRMWAWPARTRYCPGCLADSKAETGTSVWRLSWHTAWSFACTRHGCLLSDACPACGTPAGLGSNPAALVPSGSALVPAGCCRASTADGVCGEAFDGPRVQDCAVFLSGDAGARVLAAQTTLDRLMAWAQVPVAEAVTYSSFDRQVTPDQYMPDLRFLAVVHEAAATEAQRWADERAAVLGDGLACGPPAVHSPATRQAGRLWALPPASAAVNALLVTVAVETAALDTVQGEQALAPLFATGALGSQSAIGRARYAGQPSQHLQDLLGVTTRRALATESLLNSLPSGSAPTALRAETIPALFPAEEHVARFGWIPDHEGRARRVVSVCLRQLATGASIEQAAVDLGLSATATRMTFARVMRDLAAPGNLPRFRREIAVLAVQWNESPRPCYADRRDALQEWLLPLPDWDEITADLRRRQGHTTVDWAGRVVPASVYVWARVTGGEAAYCPLVAAEDRPADRSERILTQVRNMVRGDVLRLALDGYADRIAADLDRRAPASN